MISWICSSRPLISRWSDEICSCEGSRTVAGGGAGVIVKRIEMGFVQNVVLGEFGVEPLECIEILSLIGVIERLAKIEVPQVTAGGRTDCKS